MSGTLIAGLAGSLVGPIKDLISEFITDKDKANEIAYKLATLKSEQAHELALGQLRVNKEEAKHDSVFVAGWRPFIGWVCGSAMAFNYMVVPIATAFGAEMHVLDITTMFPVLLGLLGLGALRTYEKEAGVSREVLEVKKKGA